MDFYENGISLLNVTIDGFCCSHNGGVIAVVDDGTRHTAEDRLDYIEELSAGRQRHCLDQGCPFCFCCQIQLLQMLGQVL